MQLTGSNLACERGGRTVFSNQIFPSTAANSCNSPDPMVPASHRCSACSQTSANPATAKFLSKAARQISLRASRHITSPTGCQQIRSHCHGESGFLARLPRRRRSHARPAGCQSRATCRLSRGTSLRRPEAPPGTCKTGACPPSIWLLDEPGVGLDDSAQKLLAALMNGHLREGGLIIAATHVPLGLDPDKNLHLGAAP